jgi:hypothetical protein
MFSRGSKAEKVDCVCCSHTQNCAPSILSSRTLSQELKIASIRLPPNSSWWENVMAYRLSIRRSATRVIAWLAAALFFASMPILAGAAAPVQAQVAVKADFRTALEPHGTWRNSSRWGEVWVPSNRPRDWQPYTGGHWVFTDDWGWYWIEDQSEALWGVVTYHYGRWVLEDDVWVWVPGEEWGPGWVNWRGSNRSAASGRSRSRTAEASYVGWSAMPPDEVIEEYWEEPRVWVLVHTRDFTAPIVARVVLPLPEREVAIRETVVINRTVVVREQRFAVNPGIPPVLIAAEIGRPLRSYDVRPVVLAGTARIPGAVELRAEELRTAQSERIRVTARDTRNEIRPSGRLPQIQPLRPGEQGRYFDSPPRAVQRVQQGQPQQGQQGQPQPGGRDQQQGQSPSSDRQRQQQGQQGRDAGRGKQQQQGQQPGQPQDTQGRGTDEQPQQGRGRDLGKEQGRAKDLGKQQGKAKDLGKEQGKGATQQAGQPQGTDGRGTDEQRQQGREGAKQQQKGQQRGAGQQGTEGRGIDQQRQQGRDRRGEGAKQKEPQQPGTREHRPLQGTEGRGGEDQRPQRGEGARQKQQELGREGHGAAEPKGRSEGAQGRGGTSEQQRQPQQGRGEQRPMPQGGTEGRGGGGQPRSENRAAPPQQQRPSATQGRGGGLEQREGR